MAEMAGFELRGVSFAYGASEVVRDLSLLLPPGRFHGVVGPNGSGKSTLLDLLTGRLAPGRGEVSFAGRPPGAYRRRDLARRLALVPQDFAIQFGFTVEEVVLMGRHPYLPRFGRPGAADWQAVEEAMRLIGIADLRHRLVTDLSGGEKQRVVVARALAQATGCLLLDEATSNLDIHYTLAIFNVLRQRVRERGETVVAVIHNLNLAAAYCDDLIFLRQGRLAAAGPTAETLTPEVIRAVFGVESRVEFQDFCQARQVFFKYEAAAAMNMSGGEG